MIYVSSSFSLFLAVSIVLIALFPKCGSQTSNEKNPGCFGYGIGDYTAQLCGDYSKQLTTSITESKSFFFFGVAQLRILGWQFAIISKIPFILYFYVAHPESLLQQFWNASSKTVFNGTIFRTRCLPPSTVVPWSHSRSHSLAEQTAADACNAWVFGFRKNIEFVDAYCGTFCKFFWK